MSAEIEFGEVSKDRRPLSNFKYFRAIRHDLLAGFDYRVFQEPILERRFLWFSSFIVNHPDGVRRVLMDNAANYRKAELMQPILGPVLGNGLILSEGDIWKKHRRIMSPTFEAIRQYVVPMQAVTTQCADRWMEAGSIDLCSEMMSLALGILARTAFSLDSGDLEQLIAKTCTQQWPEFFFNPWTVVPGLNKVWAAKRTARIRQELAELDRAIYSLIVQREKLSPEARPDDLIGHLIYARDEENGAMSPTEVRDQIVTIFIVGHETTALALTWTLYLLARHPSHEARIVAEINSVLGGRRPTAEDLSRLAYTRMVLDEVLRLYPSAHTLGWRQALGDDEICGHKIPKGAIITISPWVIHRHKLFWDRPDEFLPERFSKERRADISRFSYIPFGLGPRYCIGAAFSVQEVLTVLATVLPRLRFTLSDNSEVKPKGMITLHPEREIRMEVHPRE